MLGETFGSYRITHKLAEGGMGAVYAAEHTLLGRPAAIKVLRPDLSSRTDMVDRFFNEARATTAIRHAGIVEVYDFGYDAQGQAYIVMELLVGESLAGRVGDGAVPIEVAVSIVRRVAQAVGAAHQQGIVHRDLKPENVFLVADGEAAFGVRPKVLDFGIAKLARDDRLPTRTQTGALLGTPMYMSPEQCKGSGLVDHRSDIYALGCILYELLVGEPPFLADGFGELIALHLTSDATPVSMRVEVPPALDVAVMRCLAKAPEDRYQTTHELVVALDVAMGMVTHTPAPPPGWVARPSAVTAARTWSMTPPPTTLGGTASQALRAMPAPRSRTPIVVGLVLAIAAVVAAVFVVAGRARRTAAAAEAPAAQPATQPVTQPPLQVVELPEEDAGVMAPVLAVDAGVPAVAVTQPATTPRKRPRAPITPPQPPPPAPASPTAPRPSSGLETDL